MTRAAAKRRSQAAPSPDTIRVWNGEPFKRFRRRNRGPDRPLCRGLGCGAHARLLTYAVRAHRPDLTPERESDISAIVGQAGPPVESLGAFVTFQGRVTRNVRGGGATASRSKPTCWCWNPVRAGTLGRDRRMLASISQPNVVEQSWSELALPEDRIGGHVIWLERKLVGVRRRDEDHKRGRPRGLDLSSRCDPAHSRHPHVH